MPAKKAQSTFKGKVGVSDVKSLDGLVFGSKDTLPTRKQTIDPERLAAALALVEHLTTPGEWVSDNKTYTTFKEAHLAGMTYRRLLILGLERSGAALKPRLRISQQSASAFSWSVYADVVKASEAAADETAAE